MSWDHEVTLIRQTIEPDEIGNQIPVEVKTTILCEEMSVTRNEFYNAASQGLKPSLVLNIHRFEYNKETELIYEDGNRYKVLRAYAKSTEEIELTCERVSNRG